MTGPTLLDAASLVCEVADDLVVRTARETHLAVLDRLHGIERAITRRPPGITETVHRGVATASYAGAGAGLRLASRGLDKAAASGAGPRLDASRAGRLVQAAVNGLIGDELLRERPQLAIPMAARVGGRDVEDYALAYPEATPRVAVLLHGLCEDDAIWSLGRERLATSCPEELRALGWTPVLLRANTGLPLRENGVALTVLLEQLVQDWPVPVEEIALVGHSMGGLIIRAACAVSTPTEPRWRELVTNVITLGSPHLGAPLAGYVGHGSRGLSWTRETAAFGKILDRRSGGVRDLVHGLTADVEPLPHANYRLVAGTVSRTERHPVGAVIGDLLVRPRSAYGRDRLGRTLFPEGTVLHVGSAHHFDLVNHPVVHRALRDWLS